MARGREKHRDRDNEDSEKDHATAQGWRQRDSERDHAAAQVAGIE